MTSAWLRRFSGSLLRPRGPTRNGTSHGHRREGDAAPPFIETQAGRSGLDRRLLPDLLICHSADSRARSRDAAAVLETGRWGRLEARRDAPRHGGSGVPIEWRPPPPPPGGDRRSGDTSEFIGHHGCQPGRDEYHSFGDRHEVEQWDGRVLAKCASEPTTWDGRDPANRPISSSSVLCNPRPTQKSPTYLGTLLGSRGGFR